MKFCQIRSFLKHRLSYFLARLGNNHPTLPLEGSENECSNASDPDIQTSLNLSVSSCFFLVLLWNNDQEVQDYGNGHQACRGMGGVFVCIAFWQNDLKCWFIVFLSYFQRSESIMMGRRDF